MNSVVKSFSIEDIKKYVSEKDDFMLGYIERKLEEELMVFWSDFKMYYPKVSIFWLYHTVCAFWGCSDVNKS